jgi:hypothetical protein
MAYAKRFAGLVGTLSVGSPARIVSDPPENSSHKVAIERWHASIAGAVVVLAIVAVVLLTVPR